MEVGPLQAAGEGGSGRGSPGLLYTRRGASVTGLNVGCVGDGGRSEASWLVHITPMPLGTRQPAEIIGGELIVRRSDPTRVTSDEGHTEGAFGV
jgi:hypothetical protein